MTEYICGGLKYYLLGGPARNYLCLRTPVQGLPESIEVEGGKLLRKAEFHVTLFATGKIIVQNNITDPHFLQKVIDTFCKFVPSHPVELQKFTGEFRLVTQGEKMTVVAMCEVSNFAELTAIFNERFGLNMEVPPTHVTLYSRDPNMGIALLNQTDLSTLTKNIPAPVEL